MSEPEDIRRAYAVTFGAPAGQLVLADLIAFCRVLSPLVREEDKDKSDRRLLMYEGRREVALRIATACNLTIEELFDINLGRRSHLRTSEGDRIDG